MSVGHFRPEPPKARRGLSLFPDRGLLFDRFDRLAALCNEGALELAGLLAKSDGANPAIAVDLLEAESIRVSIDIEESLRRALSLAIDRHDLHELSAHLTGVLALIAHTVRSGLGTSAASLSESEATTRLVDLLVRSTEGIAQAVAALRTNDHVLMSRIARDLRTLQRDASIAHDDALAWLLAREDQAARELTRASFVLDDLKQTMRRCGTTASFLSYVAVKLA